MALIYSSSFLRLPAAPQGSISELPARALSLEQAPCASLAAAHWMDGGQGGGAGGPAHRLSPSASAQRRGTSLHSSPRRRRARVGKRL